VQKVFPYDPTTLIHNTSVMESSMLILMLGTEVTMNESSTYRTFVPGTKVLRYESSSYHPANIYCCVWNDMTSL